MGVGRFDEIDDEVYEDEDEDEPELPEGPGFYQFRLDEKSRHARMWLDPPALRVEAGKQYRDQHGYNRFRLVIVTEDRNAPTCLLSAFDCLPNIDEKTHLHVIKPEALPSRIGLGC